MKPLILFISALAVAGAAHAAPLCTTSPGIWCEASVGDAGPLTQDSESTLGTGTLNAIIGNIGNGVGGSDVYSILISNPALFSASLSAYSANGVTGETNAALYLYNSLGVGVEAADEGTALTPFNGPAGVYYIGVTPTGNTPEFTVNGVSTPVFTALTGGQVSSPVNGAGSIDKYTDAGCGVTCQGAYEVTLTGAQYSNVPEPGSFAMLGGALSALGLLYRMKHSKSS